jgi:hypothetical protein
MTFLKIAAFSLIVLLSYAAFSRYGVPQITPPPPPQEEVIELSTMTLEDFIDLGDRIFHGKGNCTLCHNPLLSERAPETGGMAVRAMEVIRVPLYKEVNVQGTGGKATTGEEYLRESMIDPSAYVVPGFGVKGSEGMKSPMSVATSGSLGLSSVEIEAVIAYLQAADRVEVTVEIPEETPPSAAPEDAHTPATISSAPTTAGSSTPEEIIVKYGCGACHKIAGQEGQVGPDLTAIGKTRDREYLRRAIVDPDADVPPGTLPGIMPKDIINRMTVNELEVLIDYLVGQKGA